MEKKSEEKIDWVILKSYIEKLKIHIQNAKESNSKEDMKIAYDISLHLCAIYYHYIDAPSQFAFFGNQFSMPGFSPHYSSTFEASSQTNKEENDKNDKELTLSMWIPKNLKKK